VRLGNDYQQRNDQLGGAGYGSASGRRRTKEMKNLVGRNAGFKVERGQKG